MMSVQTAEKPVLMGLQELAARSEHLPAEVPQKGAKKAPGTPFQKGERRTGREKGTPNKVTATIREAIEIAAHQCHPQGFAGWLVERAQGGIEDRKIFAGVVGRVVPLQVQQKSEGVVRIELGWLNGRDVGRHLSQPLPIAAQVIDLEAKSPGDPVIKHQSESPEGVGQGQAPSGQDAPDAATGAGGAEVQG